MSPPGDPLLLPRRLAIELLAQAQRLPEGELLRGYLEGVAADGLRFRSGEPPAAARVWAVVLARPGAGAPDNPAAGAARVLTVGLDTKGVLQLRCWEGSAERDLRVAD